MNEPDSMQGLSQGCHHCQNGRWLCAFLTFRCQATCHFCTSPFNDDRIWTEFGPDLDDVTTVLGEGHYQGVSFTGGDCFLVPERVQTWLTHLHGHYPNLYYWVYTNGLAALPQHMASLAQAGMNEIRFNIAATDYDNPTVLKHIQKACELFEHVAVEIPSIPQESPQLIAVLPRLVEFGVQYLNLHEYWLSARDPMIKTASKGLCTFNLTDPLIYDTESLANTERIIAFCQEKKLPLATNNCSIQRKERQMLHRRLNWAHRTCQSFERIAANGTLETCCRPEVAQALRSDQTNPLDRPSSDFVHPDHCPQDGTYECLHFKPPLDVTDTRTLL